MSFYRTYIDRDVSIYKNDYINVGQNPIGELFFSSEKKDCNIYSRHLIGFDLSKLIDKYLCCELGDLSNIKHILTLYAAPNTCGKPIARNVDLVVYKLCQDFTEGCGYDHNVSKCNQSILSANKTVYSIAASNWYDASYCNQWCEEGTINYGNLTCTIDDSELPEDCIPIFEKIYYEELPLSNHNSGETMSFDYEIISKQTDISFTNKDCQIECTTESVSTISATTTSEICPLEPRTVCIEVPSSASTSATTDIDILQYVINGELQYYAEYDFSATSEIIDTINVDCASYCGIQIDLTECINEWILNWVETSGQTDDVHAIGLSYHPKIEMYGQGEYALSFYNRHTTCYYKPHLDTICDEQICDNRTSFELDCPQKLYLHTSKKLDYAPTFNLYDAQGCLCLTAETRCVDSCTYCVDLQIHSSAYTECEMFKDVWTDISVNGKKKKDVMNRFATNDGFDTDFNFDTKVLNYGIAVSGIKRDENIKCGDKRRVMINLSQPFTTCPTPFKPQKVQYRIFTKQGTSDIDVICWKDAHIMNCKYYFDLDTSWMLPTQYILEVRIEDNKQAKTNCELIHFNIIHDANCFSC